MKRDHMQDVDGGPGGRRLPAPCNGCRSSRFGLISLGCPAFAADNPQIIAKAKRRSGPGQVRHHGQLAQGREGAEGADGCVPETLQPEGRLGVAAADFRRSPARAWSSRPSRTSACRARSAAIRTRCTNPWIVKNRLDMEVDWVSEFGGMFPDIKTAAVDTVLPRYHNRLLRQWDVHYVLVYNTVGQEVRTADQPRAVHRSEVEGPLRHVERQCQPAGVPGARARHRRPGGPHHASWSPTSRASRPVRRRWSARWRRAKSRSRCVATPPWRSR